MPPTCQTCQQSNVKDINKLIAQGISTRNIAKQTSPELHYTAIFRHKTNCVPELVNYGKVKQRKGLLTDIDEVKLEIAGLKANTTNDNIKEKLIGRRFTAIDLEAKLTGAYIEPQGNEADKQLLELRTLINERAEEEGLDPKVVAEDLIRHFPMVLKGLPEAEVRRLVE